MSPLASLMLAASLTLAQTPAASPVAFPDEKDPKAKEKKGTFTISKETTYVTGPTYPDGRINYFDAINAFHSKGVTPKTNAFVAIVQAIGPYPERAKLPPALFKWLGIDEPPEKGDYFVRFDRFREEELKAPKFREDRYDDMERASQRPWKGADFPDFAQWLKANEKPLALIREGVKRSRYFSPLVSHDTKNPSLIGALVSYVQGCREIGTALTMRAMLHLGEGKYDEAWQDLLTVHRLARHVRKGSTLIEGLVSVALETIACNGDVAFVQFAKLDSRGLLERLRDLRELPAPRPFADIVSNGERLMFLDSVMLVDRNGIDGLEGLAGGGKGKGGLGNLFNKIVFKDLDWDPALKRANAMYDRMAAAMREKDATVSDQMLDDIEKDIKKLKSSVNPAAIVFGGKSGVERGKMLGDLLIALLLPATRKVATAERRMEQTLNNTQAAFALEAYRRDEGRYPRTLDELSPKYLKAVPIDIFTGKALIYRPEEKGYLLYSVGPNRKDEGGRFYEDDPPGDDPSVRVPLRERKPRS